MDSPSVVRKPAVLIVIVCLVVLEALLGLALAGKNIADLVSGTVQGGSALFVAVFMLCISVGLLFAARALLRGRRWARSAVFTWQIFQIAVGVAGLQMDVVLGVMMSAVLIAIAGVVIALMLLPSVIAATAVGPQRSGPAM